MTPKKIRVFEIGKSTAGVGEYLRWLAAGLDKTQFALTFACMSEGGDALAAKLAQIEGVTAFSIPMNRYKIAPLSDLRALLRLRREIRRGNFDLIHAHASKPGFMARLAAIGTGIPAIYSPHCFAFHAGAHSLAARGIAFFERGAARWLTSKIIAVAHAEVVLAQRYRVGSTEQFITIHSGIDTAPFDIPVQKAAARDDLNIPPDVPLVGAVGRMSRQKNPLLFVQAAALIHARLPQAHFIWVGDGPLMTAAKSLAVESGLTKILHFPGKRNDIPELLGALDLFVLPSDWEAFPLTILEAMAARLPVVATDVMGIPEIVIPGKTGLLIPPNDAPALANAIIQLLANPNHAKIMGECGRQHVESAFSRQQMIRSIAEAYQRTVA